MSEGDLYIGDDIISELEGEDAPEGAPEAPAGDETETP
jgi:hypothetical protein